MKIKPVTASGLRQCDPGWGCGHFGASRDGGKRSHLGLDYKAAPGESVYSPITGTIKRLSFPYANDLRFKGLEIIGSGEYQGFSAKIFYLVPYRTSGPVTAGGAIGNAQDLSQKYPGITNHVHLSLYMNGAAVNPANYH